MHPLAQRIGIEAISRYEHALVDYGMQQLATIPGLRLIGNFLHWRP